MNMAFDDMVEMMLSQTTPLPKRKYANLVYKAEHHLLKFLDEPKNWGKIKDNTGKAHAAILKQIVMAMEEYLSQMPVPPSLRNDTYALFCDWIERIIEQYSLEAYADLKKQLPKPVEDDMGLALIRLFHEDEPKSKADLARDLNVSEKTIQTWLRRLSPGLSEGGKLESPYRIGNQAVYPGIREAKSQRSSSGERFYVRDSSMHPVVFQMNLMQIGTLLQSLQELYDKGDNPMCLGIALDLWCQLSDYAKYRIKNHYAVSNGALGVFINMLDDEAKRDDVETLFQSEKKLFLNGESSFHEKMMYLMKNGYICNIEVKTAQKNSILENVRIEMDYKDKEQIYVAVPVDPEKSKGRKTKLTIENVKGIIIV